MAAPTVEMEMEDLKRKRAELELLRVDQEATHALLRKTARAMAMMLTGTPVHWGIARWENFSAINHFFEDPDYLGVADINFTKPKLVFSSSLVTEEDTENLGFDCVVAKGLIEASQTLEMYTQAYFKNLGANRSLNDATYLYGRAAREFVDRHAHETIIVDEVAAMEVLGDGGWKGAIGFRNGIDAQLRETLKNMAVENGTMVFLYFPD